MVFGGFTTRSVTEFYVTAFDFLAKGDLSASQLSVLAPGRIVGLRIEVADWDIGNRVKGNSFTLSEFTAYGFPTAFGYFTSADVFGDGLLIGRDRKIPGVTAVESDSWGRIKASFGR